MSWTGTTCGATSGLARGWPPPSIEQHVDRIADLFDWARTQERPIIEATVEAEDTWVVHVVDVANRTAFPSCSSWYLGANIPRKPRVFMPCASMPAHVRKCDAVAASGYKGFTLGEAPIGRCRARGSRRSGGTPASRAVEARGDA